VHGALEDQAAATVKDFNLLMGALGVGLGVAILLLVRRDHLYIRHGVFWMAVAIVSVVLGAWPRLVDRIGEITGVAYPPALLFLLAIMMLIIRAVIADIAFTRLRREVRALNQTIALMEPKVRVQTTEVERAFGQDRKADAES
jgi:hypothetical protein